MTSNHIPDRIRQVREIRQLTQAQLAEKAGLPAASISHFETGLRTPGTSTLQRLAEALEVSIDFLLGRVEEPRASGPSSALLFRNASELSERSLKLLAALSEQMKRDEERHGS